jgi:hypothetical protein
MVTTVEDETHYFKSTTYSSWEVVYPEAGTTGAIPFTLDTQNHLSMPSISQGGTVFPAHGDGWYSQSGGSFFFVFQSAALNTEAQWFNYRLEIDTDDNNNIKIFTYDGSQQLRWELCDAGRPTLAVINDGNGSCPVITIRAEILS